MPRPVPPPPPQPSPEETAVAVAYLRRVVAVGLLFFAAWVLIGYGPRSPIGIYGRKGSQGWMRMAAQDLDEEALRAHRGGRLVWLVGSSILREGIDADAANAALEAQDSTFRVVKFGQDRGATLLAAGLLRHLPIREDDVVVHNVAVQNFRSDWLAWTEIPPTRLSQVLTPGELWGLTELPVQERIEQAAAMPPRFWRWHDETRVGLERWLVALATLDAPGRMEPGYHLRFHRYERGRAFRNGIPPRELDVNGLPEGIVDFSDAQVNAAALTRMRAHVADKGAELRLLDIPPSSFAQWRHQGPQTRAAWDAWRAAQPELVYGPQLDDADYYDRRHPNFRGRAVLTDWLVSWLDSGMPQGTAHRPPEDTVEAWPWPDPPPE